MSDESRLGFIDGMARKLKSDRILFLATLLLVGLSLVMIYSASAVMAEERYAAAVLLPDQTGDVGGDWHRRLVGRDAGGLPPLQGTRLHLVRAGHRDRGARGRALQPGTQQRPALVLHRRAGHPAVGAGKTDRHLLYRSAARTAAAPDQRNAATRWRRSAWCSACWSASFSIEPDFGTSASVALIGSVMVFAAGLSYAYIGGLALLAIPMAGLPGLREPVSLGAARLLSQPLGRPARQRLSNHPVASLPLAPAA